MQNTKMYPAEMRKKRKNDERGRKKNGVQKETETVDGGRQTVKIEKEVSAVSLILGFNQISYRKTLRMVFTRTFPANAIFFSFSTLVHRTTPRYQ